MTKMGLGPFFLSTTAHFTRQPSVDLSSGLTAPPAPTIHPVLGQSIPTAGRALLRNAIALHAIEGEEGLAFENWGDNVYSTHSRKSFYINLSFSGQ